MTTSMDFLPSKKRFFSVLQQYRRGKLNHVTSASISGFVDCLGGCGKKVFSLGGRGSAPFRRFNLRDFFHAARMAATRKHRVQESLHHFDGLDAVDHPATH